MAGTRFFRGGGGFGRETSRYRRLKFEIKLRVPQKLLQHISQDLFACMGNSDEVRPPPALPCPAPPQYMYKTMVENSKMMWTFKKQFSSSTALSAVACHVLLLTGRSPGKILVSKSSGRVGHTGERSSKRLDSDFARVFVLNF
jgi:hypothetical protein